MVEIDFNYDGIKTTIQSDENNTMKDIINKFLSKTETKENNLNYLYNGDQINIEQTFKEQANTIDQRRNRMSIVVLNINNNNQIAEEKCEKISKDIICPICKENALLDIKDFKINLSECTMKHKIKDILLNKFEESQKIDLNKIKCNICKQNDKGHTHNNLFYICKTCNKNICPLCKSIHDNKHSIINYDDKDFICKKHNEPFNKYCKTCKDNICIICENKHKKHEIFDLNEILINKDELSQINEKLKNAIDKFKYQIIIAKAILDKMSNLMDLYYNINNNIFTNYNMNRRNYYILSNLNNLKNNNEKLMKKIDTMINNDNISELCKFSFDNFYAENGEKYIGEMYKGIKNGKGILYYTNGNRYEGDFKNNKREGKGILYFKDGNRYEGDWKNDIIEGKGTMYYNNGNKYDGDWKNNEREGKGIMYMNNDDRYEGYWKKDKKEGKGKYFWNNGDR